jgi:hypothetical protein
MNVYIDCKLALYVSYTHTVTADKKNECCSLVADIVSQGKLCKANQASIYPPNIRALDIGVIKIESNTPTFRESQIYLIHQPLRYIRIDVIKRRKRATGSCTMQAKCSNMSQQRPLTLPSARY